VKEARIVLCSQIQDSAYSCKVWITLNKLLYAPLQYPRIGLYIHEGERLCGRLLCAILLVSENKVTRKLAEQAGSHTPEYGRGVQGTEVYQVSFTFVCIDVKDARGRRRVFMR
jgi:hypothetical protein